MAEPKTAECQVGQFKCPNTRTLVPLMSSQAFAFLHWPVLVERCPSCGERHQLEVTDVEHPPVYGRE